jgi:ATP-dependent DNA helicase 2 subunit 1
MKILTDSFNYSIVFNRELVKVVQKVSSTGDIIDAKAVGNTRITAAMSRSTANEARLRSFVKFGGQGELVPMNKVDKVNIKKAGNANIEFASLILLGFKDKSAVPFMHTQEATYFAYPNDETVEGSCSAFAHLHASMLRKGVVAIGELLTRSNASSRLVVVTAVAEELVEEQVNGEIVVQLSKPPGMMVVGLPFEDEVRAMGPDEAVRSLESGGTGVATESIVDAACALIEHHPVLPEDAEIGRNFENVALKKLWDYIEHVSIFSNDFMIKPCCLTNAPCLQPAGSYRLLCKSQKRLKKALTPSWTKRTF